MDIRKYFGGGGPPQQDPKVDDEDKLNPPKKSTPKRTTPRGKIKSAPMVDRTTKEGKTLSTMVSPGLGRTTEKTTPQQTPNSVRQKRQKTNEPSKKRIIIESDDEDEEVEDLMDSEFEIDLDGEDSDDAVDLVSLGDDGDDGLEANAGGQDEKVTPEKPQKGGKRKAVTAEKPKKQSSAKKPKKASGILAGLQDDPVALAAVAAVDKAVSRLPPEESLGFTLMSEGSYMGRAPDEPVRAGEKHPPIGHPDCLTGKTFVISGVLDSLTREQASDFIKRHGGKVTTNVSSRTSFLVVGQFTGRTKYHTAKSNNVPLINEDGLFSLVAAAPAAPGAAKQQELPSRPAAAVDAQTIGSSSFYTTGGPDPAKPLMPPNRPAPIRSSMDDGQLWVEKWRPRTAADLVGNQAIVGTLRQWLRDWERVHLHGSEPTMPPGARGKDRSADMKKKAVLLSGSPGIGKTSSALIITRELGYEPIEVNASDARSKSDASVLKGVGGKLANAVKELTTNAAVSYNVGGKRKKLCLIMDEVDGMSAGDRGGVADLIKTIAKSKVPIIAICNDKYSTKLRSLRNHCMELDFRKPTVQQIAKRMLEIAHVEGLTVNSATMEALVQSANGGDIRLILGQLQMLRLRAKSLTYDQVKSGGAGTAKDLEMSPFEAAKRLLDPDASASLSLADQIELVFQDADLVPLLVQENYLNHRPRIAANETQRMAVIAKAAEGFSAGDVANRSVRQYQNWALMPFAATMGTVNPAAYCRGVRETFGLYPNEPNFPRFTAWLGQNSSFGKQRRLMGELHTRMLSSGNLECDRTAVRLSYLPVLRAALTKPLVLHGKDGIEQVLELMRDYCIIREDIEYILDVTKFKTKAPWGEDPYKAVETAVKSAFTRTFNAQHLKPKTGFGMEEGKKKRGKRGAGADEEEDEGDGLGEEGEGNVMASKQEEEEEEDMDPALLRRKLMGMKHKGMELTLKDGSKAPKVGGTRGGRGGGRGGGRSGGRGGARGKK